jgi:hypothetical protein
MEMFPEKSDSKLSLATNKITFKHVVFIAVFLAGILIYFVWSPFEKKGLFCKIPLYISENGSPYIKANVQGSKHFLEIDTGACSYFSINKEILEKIKAKKEETTTHSLDVKGNLYTSPLYSIEKIQIHDMAITHAPTKEEDPFFHNEGSVIKRTKKYTNKTVGRIGAPLLRLADYWLMDIPNKYLYAIKDLEKIKTTPGFSFEGFTEVSLEPIKPHIVINIETDFGVKKFAIDTGASRTFLRTTPDQKNHDLITSNHFVIGGHEYGPTQIYLFDISPRVDQFDGVVGRDFLKKHAIYLDFKSEKAFIGPLVE